eukprot:20027_1
MMGAAHSKKMTPAYKTALKNESKDETKCNEPELATFGAGCFWGVELTFQRIPGVTKTQVGYCGGGQDNPTYREVCTGLTGHAEVVQLEFNPEIVDFSSPSKFFSSVTIRRLSTSRETTTERSIGVRFSVIPTNNGRLLRM